MRIIELVEMYRSLTRMRSSIENELIERLTWEDLYTLGLTLAAIRKYRNAQNPPISLVQAKNEVEQYFKGRNYS